MQRRSLLVLFLMVALGACASMRKVEVGSGTAETVRISVYNARTSSVILGYESGGAIRDLGTVGAKATRQFVVPVSGASVLLRARSSAGVDLGAYPVSATTGSTQSVTIN